MARGFRYGFGYGVTQVTTASPAGAPTLSPVSLSSNSVAEGAGAGTVVGNVLGLTSGSTRSLTDTAGGRFTLSGTQIVTTSTPTDFETSGGSYSITFRETLAGAANSPRDTILTISVSDVPLPTFTAAPVISGTGTEGQTLTRTRGTVSGGALSAGQWYRGATPISGATGSTYVLQAADVGFTITWKDTAINGANETNVSSSNGIGPVQPLVQTSEVISVEILGNTRVPDPAGDGQQGTIGNGWIMKIVTPFRAGATFDPSKVVVTSKDNGFTPASNGAVVEQTRTIRGGEIIRRQYVVDSSPASNTLRLATQNGANLEIYVSLREPIYQGANSVSVYVESGFYTGAAYGQVTNVTNNSVRAYPEPQVGFLSYPSPAVTGTDFTVEGLAFHVFARQGQQVAAVGFYARDSQATPNQTPEIIVTAPTLSNIVNGQVAGCPRPEVWRANIPMTVLTQGDTCYAYMKIYPWIGPAWDMRTQGQPWPSTQADAALKFVCDKNGTYGGVYAYVNAQTGSDTTGVADTNPATARASPCATVDGALAKIQAKNNTTFSGHVAHNDCGGGFVRLMDNAGADFAHTLTATSSRAGGAAFVTVEQDPLNTGVASLTFSTVNMGVCSSIRFKVNITSSGNFNGFGGVGNIAVFDGCTMSLTGGNPFTYNLYAAYFVNCVNPSMRQSFNVVGDVVMLAGCTHTTGAWILCPRVISCYFPSATSMDGDPGGSPNKLPWQNGLICYNNIFQKVIRISSFVTTSNLGPRGIAIVQCLWETKFAGPVLGISRDGNANSCENVNVQHLTIPGESSTGGDASARFNFCYNDSVGSARVVKEGYLRFCLLNNLNCKTDTFTSGGTIDPTGRTGNWFTRYRVGSFGNVIPKTQQGDSTYDANGGNAAGGQGNWFGEYNPSDTVGGVSVAYTNNQAGNGAAGGGTYTLAGGAANPAVGKVPSGMAVLKYDLAGVPRKNDGNGAAGAYERTDI